ncbi:MAG TPA: sulfurtransferase TusA family protein [Wenzhouxiangella sp.]|nr:sulfurtransferase TusA family protein [Wenzhouxiangella sp.]
MTTNIPQDSSTSTDSGADRRLDVRGHACPVPAVEARRCLDAMGPGQVLEVLATDPLAEMDLQILCDRLGHELLSTQVNDDEQVLKIRVSESRRADDR